VKSLQTL